eukprot:15483169-Alexandrium_andersonii.AAC.1
MDEHDELQHVADFMASYSGFVYQTPETPISPLTGQELRDCAMSVGDTAAGPDAWSPKELKFLGPEAFRLLAQLLNSIEAGLPWPRPLVQARTAIMAKEEGHIQDFMSFRALTILSSVHRLWNKTRLRQLQPWVSEWTLPELFAGVPGRSAEQAWMTTALEAEFCGREQIQMDATSVDLYKAFDTVPRRCLYVSLALSGLSSGVLRAYGSFHEHLMVRHQIAGSVGEACLLYTSPSPRD